MNLVGDVPDETRAFKNVFVGIFTGNDRALDGLALHRMDHVTDVQARDVHLQHPHVRVVNILGHLAVINGLL